MNVQLLFYLICKFCADSQNQEPSVDWDTRDCTGHSTQHTADSTDRS